MARPEILFPLFADIDGLSGVGPKIAGYLSKLNIKTKRDLLFHLPIGGKTWQRVSGLDSLDFPSYVVFEAQIISHRRAATKRQPYTVTVDAQFGLVELTFFHPRIEWLKSQFPLEARRVIGGKLERFGERLQMVHPEYSLELGDESAIPVFEPQYGLTAGLTGKTMRKIAENALSYLPELPEWIREELLEAQGWSLWRDAVFQAHHPARPMDCLPQSPARARLAFDEIFSHQLAFALAHAARKKKQGVALEFADEAIARAKDILPFEMTGAQKRAVDDIFGDLRTPHRMNRLLQGDVGSGKTAVAFLMMAAVVAAGGQVAFMAPTEILARQHFQDLKPWIEKLGHTAAILTGRDKGKARNDILAKLADGGAKFIFGTHALFQDNVEYQNLRAVIVDEQHRFGVDERKRLTEKGARSDVLVMSATPIPRSLTMSIYGDMDLSVLDEKPAGREKIDTVLLSDSKLDQLLERIDVAIREGRQIYWVCPLVGESEKLDLMAAEERYALFAKRYGERAAMVHGQMPSAAKDEAMSKFAAGEVDILVATTAIEVGVNVPNASIMVIESAERFGLAQLHQLRGRVGRGNVKSTCVLLYHEPLSATAKTRLSVIRDSDDGFFIAEEDLRMRGAGDVLGAAQSGLPRYRIANVEAQPELVNLARDEAKYLLAQDPELRSTRGEAARILLYLQERDRSIQYLNIG